MPASRPFQTAPDDGAGRGLLATFDRCLAEQDALCRALEDLADSLPGRLDTHGAVLLLGRLGPLLRRCHHLEEEVIFPALRAARRDLGPVLDRLSAEHLEDEAQAGELEEAVVALAARWPAADAERLGYMLRGLFTALRRHVAHDRDRIRPLLGLVVDEP